MDIGMIFLLSLIVPILVLLGVIIAKMAAGKPIPSSHYTPFDHITGHAPAAFHEEKEEKEERGGQDDDKDKTVPRQPR